MKKVTVMGEQALDLHSKIIWKKIEILTNKVDQKKDSVLQYLHTDYLSSEISASKYVHMFVCKAEYVEQYFMSLFTIVAQAAVKEFYVVSNASFSRREFFRCLISVTGNILCAIQELQRCSPKLTISLILGYLLNVHCTCPTIFRERSKKPYRVWFGEEF